MSTVDLSLLPIISQQVYIYLGLALFIAGVFGGLLNIIVFLSLETFRQSSCAFYLTIISIIHTFQLSTGLFTLIMINGFNINWLNMSLFYCKFRAFYVNACIAISLTCMCVATIDQFLATCSNPRWHRWNNIKIARFIVIGTTVVWLLHGIPFLIYYGHILSPITGTSSCIITNDMYQKYYTLIHGCVIGTSLPILIMILFGLLGYRNVQQIAYRTVPLVRRELDKQLTKMVLTEAFCDVLFVTPLFLHNAVSGIINAPNNSITQMILRFIVNLATLWYYLYVVSPFYIYVCVSKRFRQQLIHVLFTTHLKWFDRRGAVNNQVEPQT